MIRVVHPGSRIPDPDADFLPSRIPDPGVKKHPIPDPGSGSATLNQSMLDMCTGWCHSRGCGGNGGADRSPLLMGADQPPGSHSHAINQCQSCAQAGAIVKVVGVMAGPTALSATNGSGTATRLSQPCNQSMLGMCTG
jgi:hypothetical protein